MHLRNLSFFLKRKAIEAKSRFFDTPLFTMREIKNLYFREFIYERYEI